MSAPEESIAPSAWKVGHQYFLRTRPSEVFRAITTPSSLVKWLCDRAELEPRTGGRYLLAWNDGPTHEGPVLEFVPARSVALGWSWEGIELQGTVLRMAVRPEGEGALFEISHTGFPREARWGELYAGAEWGWTYFAMNLKSVLEHGADLRSKLDG